MDIFFDNGILNKNKLRESWVIKNLPDIYQKIIELDNTDIKFSNKLYNYYNDIIDKPLCIQCNSDFSRFKGFNEGYDNFCSKRCASRNSLPEALGKRKRNTIEKWGVDHTSKLKSVKKKQEATNIKKYGYKSPTQNKDIKKKQEETMLSRWGVENTGSSPYLMDKVFKTRFDNYKNRINEIFGDLNIIGIPTEGTLMIKCSVCSEIYETKTYLLRLRKLRYKINPCLICNPNNSYKYSGQNEIIEFLKDHVNKIEIANRTILMGKELDIYLPDYNLAIEYNGLYWHSDIYKDKYYHLNKKDKCEENGINLIHIWEDDWSQKKDLVKSKILNLFKLSTRIYSRSCKIVKITNKVNNEFLKMNNLGNNKKSSYRIGLEFNDKLVSVLTLIKTGKDWEVSNFCTIQNNVVIGAFSKLLKTFIKEHKPSKISAYISRDWSNSENVFSANGFKEISKLSPNYWYFRKDNIRISVSNSHKSSLNRIWDCGELELTLIT